MSDPPKRYVWEDALVAAERAGVLSGPAVTFCLRLSTAINWAPMKGGRDRPGLYWENDTAFAHVGTSRSTYKRVKRELFESGFLALYRDNLVPCLPARGVQIEPLGGSRLSQEGGADWTPIPCRPSLNTFPEDEAAATEKEAEIAALVAMAPPFEDEDATHVSAAAGEPAKPLTTAEIEALLATLPPKIADDPFRSSPPRTPHPKDATYSRNALEREAKEQGFDPDTGEYQSRATERAGYRSRR